MKKILFILFSFFPFAISFAQDQTIDGQLNVVGDITLRGAQNPSTFGEYGRKLYFGVAGENGDGIFFSRFNITNDHSELRLSLGNDGSERLVIGNIHYTDGLWRESLVFRANGYVGFGVSDPTCPLDVNGQIKSTKLDVNGTIRAKEVKIEATGWADFVFYKDYKLPTLKEVETHIKEKGTLPDIPSEKEVKETGIDVGDMQTKLLQKIEELTLYVIELKKENEAQDILIEKLLEEKENN